MPCDLMLVGEAPGANEEVERRPFVGEAGKLLDNLLSKANISRASVYISNVVKCRPPQNRTPTKEEQVACSIYLIREIKAVQPKVIIALGGTAAKALAGVLKVGENRGKILPLRSIYRHEAKVIVTYHPAAAMHQGFSQRILDQIASDFRVAAKMLNGSKQDYAIITSSNSEAKVNAALNYLSSCSVIAVDCEWEMLRDSGTYPWSRRDGRLPKLKSVAIAGEVEGKIISCAMQWPIPKQAVDIIESIPSVYHNAPSDLAWLMAHNVTPRLAGDTLLLASILNIPGSLGLKAIAPSLTDMEAGWNYGIDLEDSNFPISELLTYNAKDAVATIKLNPVLEERLVVNEKLSLLYRNVLLPSIVHLTRAALTGVPIDYKRLAELEGKALEELFSLRQHIEDILGVQGFAAKKPRSGEQAAIQLEQLLGIKLPRTGKTDKPSITMETLSDLKEKHPVCAKWLRVLQLEKLISTYLTPWNRMLSEQQENSLHTVYKLWVARTGRSSAEVDMGGTIQQAPRGQTFRNLVKAPLGWKILWADESQVEMRVAAWMAREQNMITAFKEGVDLHKLTAAYIKALGNGISLDDFLALRDQHIEMVTKDERQSAKGPNFGFLYFGSENVVIRLAKKDYNVILTQAQAIEAKAAYFELYPGLISWHESAWKWVDLGYVESPLGRRRDLTEDVEGRNGLHRKAINTPTQATASDFALLAMCAAELQIEDRGISDYCKLIGFIHDALLYLVRDDYVDELSSIVQQAMEHPPFDWLGINFDVPLEAEVLVDQMWR